MSVVLTHSVTGQTKVVPSGFSWTTLFFGIFPALFRGDIKWAAIMFVAAFFTLGLSWLVFPFMYNKVHIDDLLKTGWTYQGQMAFVPQGQTINVNVNSSTAPAN